MPVHDVEYAKLLGSNNIISQTAQFKDRVQKAYQLQTKRLGGAKFNSSMTNRQVTELVQLSSEAKELLVSATEKLDIFARAYIRSVRVAWTIADLDDSDQLLPVHISEALQYRYQAAASPVLAYGD